MIGHTQNTKHDRMKQEHKQEKVLFKYIPRDRSEPTQWSGTLFSWGAFKNFRLVRHEGDSLSNPSMMWTGVGGGGGLNTLLNGQNTSNGRGGGGRHL